MTHVTPLLCFEMGLSCGVALWAQRLILIFNGSFKRISGISILILEEKTLRSAQALLQSKLVPFKSRSACSLYAYKNVEF